jgi:hypothetical protein
MKLPEIVTELASVYHEEAFDENKVKYRSYKFKLHRPDLSDWPSSADRLEELDARILQVLEPEPWFRSKREPRSSTFLLRRNVFI